MVILVCGYSHWFFHGAKIHYFTHKFCCFYINTMKHCASSNFWSMGNICAAFFGGCKAQSHNKTNKNQTKNITSLRHTTYLPLNDYFNHNLLFFLTLAHHREVVQSWGMCMRKIWASAGVSLLFWLLSNSQLEEVCGLHCVSLFQLIVASYPR